MDAADRIGKRNFVWCHGQRRCDGLSVAHLLDETDVVGHLVPDLSCALLGSNPRLGNGGYDLPGYIEQVSSILCLVESCRHNRDYRIPNELRLIFGEYAGGRP